MLLIVRNCLMLIVISAVGVCSAKEVGGDFTLVAHDGSEYSLQDSRGKVVVIAFGYTFCPDICPTALSTISSALNSLGDDVDLVDALFVSLDPERDTLEHLAEYTQYFHTNLLGLTGTPEQLHEIAKLYQVRYDFVDKGTNKYYTMDHSANLYIIDAEGNLVRILPHGLPPQALLDSLRFAIVTSQQSMSHQSTHHETFVKR
ncbi:SCO family protein [Candidatus Thiodiazotropha sp. CDECU1]|uniref:SCO family protein n=1 Tax=Candidatus Thiodiazotropha sp. CDECU1 TaxID=3065865 RepID=UPI00292CE27C|nr:SCO family protein [Candidatus Thiodiazotropha sp. CDECU1]